MRRLAPGDAWLEKRVEADRSYEEMIDEWEQESNIAISPSTLASALRRAGLSKTRANHRRAAPWRVKVEYQNDWNLQMLRALSRRKQGIQLAEATERNLTNWLNKIQREDVLIGYQPERGFIRIARDTVPSELRDPDYPTVLMNEHGDQVTLTELRSRNVRPR